MKASASALTWHETDFPPLRGLIVGVGCISRQMLEVLKSKPWFQCVGLADVNEANLAAGKELAALPESGLFRDLGQALEKSEPDVVLINTPAELHFAQACQCLEAGRHVLAAKPLTTDFSQAVELVALARRQGVTLSVAQQIRYNRHYRAVASFVKSGVLGSVEAAWLMNSKPRPNVGNLHAMRHPALYENACHHFDALLAVFEGRIPEWISCDGFLPSWSKYAGPSMVNALIRFSGNVHVSYHGGFAAQAPMYEFRLEGSQGVLRCRGIHMSNDTMEYEFAPPLGQFQSRRIDDSVPLQDPWFVFLDLWHDYVRGGVEPPFSGRNNLKVCAMLDAAIESVETGRPVDIAGHPRYAVAFERSTS